LLAGISRTYRRVLIAGVAAATMGLNVTSVDAAGSKSPDLNTRHIHKVSAPTKPQKPAQLPLAISKAPVVVMVQLAGDPVAVVQGNSGRNLTNAERSQIAAALKAKQNALLPSIRGLGGQVLDQYHFAYNGIKVRIARTKVTALISLPGVVDVEAVRNYTIANTESVPYIGAPQAWDNPSNFHGEGIKLAVIDTGIDYTHADFGIDTTAVGYVDYQTAEASASGPAPVTEFGPAAPRVKGGTDLAGDNYDAGSTDPAKNTPAPDPNPIDCNEHGTHTAGTSAGGGVLASGAPYTGPYNDTIYGSNSFNVGPGVAPMADIYSIKVFGCTGSTNLVTDALDWAVANSINVVNMSLGSTFGGPNDPDSVASTNATLAGIVVVASAGNDGPSPYMTGSPASGRNVLSVAATDSRAGVLAATVAFNNATSIVAQNSNLAIFADGTTYPDVKVITNDPSTPTVDEALGCSASDYTWDGVSVTGKLAIVHRGTCARIQQPAAGQSAGAGAVAMINTSAGYPPVEGQIQGVTIPFLGIQGPLNSADATTADNADGTGTVTLTNTSIANPTYTQFASFTSFGPRDDDSALKPDLTAPGVSIVSAGMGTATGSLILSGTSMAAPHVAGSAALVKQAHPTWSVPQLNAALANTGDPSRIGNFSLRGGGSGLVQPATAAKTQVIAQRIANGQTMTNLSFGFEEITGTFSAKQTITLTNTGSSAAKFNIGHANDSGVTHSVTLSKATLKVAAHSSGTVDVTLNVPAGSVPRSTDSGTLSFFDAGGIITFTPADASQNNNISLRVPFYTVPRSQSKVSSSPTSLPSNGGTLTIKNDASAAVAGDADFYTWGINDNRTPGLRSIDVRAVGVQSFPFGGDQLMVFAVNTWDRWSTPASDEFDVLVDVDGDNVPDYDVVGVDQGAITTSSFSGVVASFVFDLRTNLFTLDFLATSPTDSSTLELPALASQLCQSGSPCLSSGNPRINYQVQSFDLRTGAIDSPAGTGHYNAYTPAISNGMFDTINPGNQTTENITVDQTELALTPALGVMVVTLDNLSGRGEAQTIPVG